MTFGCSTRPTSSCAKDSGTRRSNKPIKKVGKHELHMYSIFLRRETTPEEEEEEEEGPKGWASMKQVKQKTQEYMRN